MPSAQSRLQDIEGGPYEPLTEDEINGAILFLRDRVMAALHTFNITRCEGPLRDKMMSATNLFLVDVCANNKQRDQARSDMDALVDDITDPIDPTSPAKAMKVIGDIIDNATAIQLRELE